MSLKKQAIVIGGSLAGLLAARILCDHFTEVTLIERDRLNDMPEARKGQPHVRALHGLLANGTVLIQRLFPDLLADLQAAGALVNDMGETMRWYTAGGYRCPFTFGIPSIGVSRPFLEWQIRRRVLSLPNLTVRDGCGVADLISSPDHSRVVGVQLADSNRSFAQTITADLVIDASGRGSAAPRWLTALGYQAPEESKLKVDVGYAARLYQRDPNDPRSRHWHFVTPVAPRERRMAGAFPIENNQWLVGLGGWFGDHPPADAAGFLAYAQSLPTPDIANIITSCQPISDIFTYKYMASQRRHYEHLHHFPAGFLVIGDAVCSFNPVYGQGMTTAAMQAHVLDQLLLACHTPEQLDRLAPQFFQQAAKVIDIPWQLAVGEDYRFPEAVGPRPPSTNLINSYIDLVHRATHHDPIVGHVFLEVMNLIKPPSSLLAPQIMFRVLKQRLTTPQAQIVPAVR